MKLLNSFFGWYCRRRIPMLRSYWQQPEISQNAILMALLRQSANTEWGKKYDYKSIKTVAEYQSRVPISTYEDIAPYIDRMIKGEPNVLYTGLVSSFSKSSGTTNDKSKFIPVTAASLNNCQIKGSLDMASWWYENNPNTQWMGLGASLVMGGTWKVVNQNPRIIAGDVSGLMMQFMPFYAKTVQALDTATAVMPEWEAKIERIVKTLAKNPKLTNISGVPTWTLVLLRQLLDYTGKSNALELFPNFEVYMHGGVSFEPYRAQFNALFPSDKVQYRNIYNASEGFFAGQIDSDSDDMLLLMDNGVFFEFLPLDQLDNPNARPLTVAEVEVGRPYALLITTNAGLWRYLIGDVVQFASLHPHKIQIVGRTQQFINVFGEELMVSNTDEALRLVCQQHKAEIVEYTAAPIFLTEAQKGGHEWLIEFRQPPANILAFAADLDATLKQLNSDYEAKRHKDIALLPLVLHSLPTGSFQNWLKSKGKIGGQHKVPRLSNNRKYIEEILSTVNNARQD